MGFFFLEALDGSILEPQPWVGEECERMRIIGAWHVVYTFHALIKSAISSHL